MKSDQPREIGLGDLAQLTLRANVIFAVRCAQRLRPCFELAVDAPRRDEQMEAVDSAIAAALAFCRNADEAPGRAAAAAVLAGVVAEETCDFTRFAGYVAVRAAEAAGYAEAYLAQPSDAGFIEVVAAAFGAGRVLVTNADPNTRVMVVEALLVDFENLQRLDTATYPAIGEFVDPTEAGPLGSLWPKGRPFWVGETEAECPTILRLSSESACR